MSLSKEAATQSLGRIFSLFHPTPQQAVDYTTTIIESVGWMDAIKFEDVCKELIKEISPGRKPVPSQFVKAYHKLAKERGWDTKSSVKLCDGCQGKSLVQTYLANTTTDQTYSAMKPCPICRPNESVIREGFIEIPREDYEKARDYDRKTRAGWFKLCGFEWPAPLDLNEGAKLCAEYMRTEEGRRNLAKGSILQKLPYDKNESLSGEIVVDGKVVRKA